jgi:hypothetical protein
MELQRIISTQTNVEPGLEEIRKGVPLVSQEQCIVAQRTHRNTDLLKIEQILQRRDLTKQDPMGDGMGCQECRREVVSVPSFSTVGSENEGI